MTKVYVYILQSLVDSGYYIGISKNIGVRLEKHNRGGNRSTRKRKPFKLIYSEEYNNYAQARKREKELKAYKGGDKFKAIIR